MTEPVLLWLSITLQSLFVFPPRGNDDCAILLLFFFAQVAVIQARVAHFCKQDYWAAKVNDPCTKKKSKTSKILHRLRNSLKVHFPSVLILIITRPCHLERNSNFSCS